jgi:hypothetical protein
VRHLVASLALAASLWGGLVVSPAAAQTFTQPLNYAYSTLALAHAPASGKLQLQPGTGRFFGTPTAGSPIRVVAFRLSTLQQGVILPTSTRTVFKVTGRTDDLLTGVTAASDEDPGNVDQAFVRNDPVIAPTTRGAITEIHSALADLGFGTVLGKVSATAVLDFPGVAAGGQQELTIAVTGAAAGGTVQLAPPASIEPGLVWAGRVSSAGVVSVRVSNLTSGVIDPAGASWRATVENY